MTSLNVVGIAFEHSRAPAKRRQGRELSAVNTYIRRAMGSTTAYFGGPKSATPKPLTADRQGFSLNAAVACTAQQRSKLERIARPFCTNQGLALPSRSSDSPSIPPVGSCATPLPQWHDAPDVHPRGLARAARRTRASTSRASDALCPPFTWGVFATNCRLRARIVPSVARQCCEEAPSGQAPGRLHAGEPTGTERRRPPHRPHDLDRAACDAPLQRVFRIDITTCPDCGGRLRWIADVTEPMVIRKILLHVQSRAPPGGGVGGEHHPTTDTTFTLAG